MQARCLEAVDACTRGRMEDLQSIWNTTNEEERQNAKYFRSMLQAASKARQVAIVQYLVTQNPHFKIDRETGLAIATGGSVEIYEELYKLDPEVVNLHFGHTGDPVTVAVQTGNLPVLAFLLDKKADPNAGRFSSRLSPIALAAMCSTEEIVILLVRHVAQLAASNALQAAISFGRLDLVRCLLLLGANANDTPDYVHHPKLFENLETPLHTAVRVGNIEAAKLLLDHGANPVLTDSNGKSVIGMAQENGRADIIELLRSRNG